MGQGTDHERIGPTAHYTAYVWHRLGLPYAKHFATRQGAVLYWGFFALGEWTTRVLPAVPSMREYLEYRHRLIDAAVQRLRPGCVVELGAGLTRRALTWALDHQVAAREVDLPAMAQRKRDELAALPHALSLRLAGVHEIHDGDVTAPEFGTRLAAMIGEHGEHGRPVVVAEGLLSYFDPQPRRAVLHEIADGLRQAGGGVLICDLHTAAAQAEVGAATHVLRATIGLLTRRKRALDPFADWDALRGAFEQAGFDTCDEVRPADYVDMQPRLARLHSPAHVIIACVHGKTAMVVPRRTDDNSRT